MGHSLRNGLVKPKGVSIHCVNKMTGLLKIKHESEWAAWEHARQLKEKRQERYEAYFCSFCKHFHAGRPSSNLKLSLDSSISKRAMVQELGERAFYHLMMGDTVRVIEGRYKTVRKRYGVHV